MIPFDFDYVKPTSVRTAVEKYRQAQEQGKKPIYLAGGTEIVTWARTNAIHMDIVIDIKAIPECMVMERRDHQLVIGSCVPLSAITAANMFPLLSETARGIADQSARNQITLGGNLCGQIHYRETALPLLLANSRFVIAGLKGTREAPMQQVFSKQMNLDNGEFLVQILIDEGYLPLPYYHTKKRQIGNVGYPLVTLAALKRDQRIHTAYSGVCAFPFQSALIDQTLNDASIPLPQRVDQAIQQVPVPILSNAEGSAAYRSFALKQSMTDAILALEGR